MSQVVPRQGGVCVRPQRSKPVGMVKGGPESQRG